MSAADKTDDLAVLVPLRQVVVISDLVDGSPVPVEVEIIPIKMGQLSRLMGVVAPIITVIRKVAPVLKDEVKIRQALGQLLLSNPSEIMEMIAICTNKDLVWVENRDLDEVVKLALAVVEVNLDFFIQKLLPCVLQAMAQVGSVQKAVANQSGGLTPSNG